MTSNNRNTQTIAALTQEIKDLSRRCVETCNIISNNTNAELQGITFDNLQEKSLCYIDGLLADIQGSGISFTADANLLTSQFLSELDDKILQLKQLVAYKKGLVLDIDADILRFNNQIKIAEDAKSYQKSDKIEVQPEHLQRAKEKFHKMKKELHGLVKSLYPDVSDSMMHVLANLMNEKLTEGSSGYLEIESDCFHVVELLRDMGIVVINPYNNKEIKLTQ